MLSLKDRACTGALSFFCASSNLSWEFWPPAAASYCFIWVHGLDGGGHARASQPGYLRIHLPFALLISAFCWAWSKSCAGRRSRVIEEQAAFYRKESAIEAQPNAQSNWSAAALGCDGRICSRGE